MRYFCVIYLPLFNKLTFLSKYHCLKYFFEYLSNNTKETDGMLKGGSHI